MGKYGQTAKLAVELLISNEVSNPIEAWTIAAERMFPNSLSSRDKACPKSSFLSLCEDGYIVNVEKGNYTRSKKNKEYALKAISLLKSNSSLSEKELWSLVIGTADKQYNSQMDVVKILWDKNYINQNNIPTLK